VTTDSAFCNMDMIASAMDKVQHYNMKELEDSYTHRV